MGDRWNQRILRIDNNQGCFAIGDPLEVVEDKVGESVRLPMAGTGDDPVMLESGLLWNHEWDFCLEQFQERGAR